MNRADRKYDVGYIRALARVADEAIMAWRRGEIEFDVDLDPEVAATAATDIEEATAVFKELHDRNKTALQRKDARLKKLLGRADA